MRPTPGKNRANPQTFGLTGHGSGSLSLFGILLPLSNRQIENCYNLPKRAGGGFFPQNVKGRKTTPRQPLLAIIKGAAVANFVRKFFINLQIPRS